MKNFLSVIILLIPFLLIIYVKSIINFKSNVLEVVIWRYFYKIILIYNFNFL